MARNPSSQNQASRSMRTELLEGRDMMSAWHNYLNAFDVNADAIANQADHSALSAFISANAGVPFPVPPGPDPNPSPISYYDVNDDFFVSSMDLEAVGAYLAGSPGGSVPGGGSGTGTGTGTGGTGTNLPLIPADDMFFLPDDPYSHVEIDVLMNDYFFDAAGRPLQLVSVTSPDDGGSTTIVGNKVHYYPPLPPTDPTVDVLPVSVMFSYTVADPNGFVAQADVKAAAKTVGVWREYSRGNDDPNANIYETADIKIRLSIDQQAKKIKLIYMATATTTTRLRGTIDAPVAVGPDDADQGMPEFKFFQPALFLHQAERTVGTPVPPEGYGVPLKFTEGGIGGSLGGEIELASYDDASDDPAGTAVVQMHFEGLFYPVRQDIEWDVDIVEKDGKLEIGEIKDFKMSERPYGRQLPIELRIVNSSNKNGDVFKLPYPDKPGLARDLTPGGDPTKPATVPADWNTKVKATGDVTP